MQLCYVVMEASISKLSIYCNTFSRMTFGWYSFCVCVFLRRSGKLNIEIDGELLACLDFKLEGSKDIVTWKRATTLLIDQVTSTYTVKLCYFSGKKDYAALQLFFSLSRFRANYSSTAQSSKHPSVTSFPQQQGQIIVKRGPGILITLLAIAILPF